MINSTFSGLDGFSGAFLWVIVGWLVTTVIHVAFAWAVLVDADLQKSTRGSKTYFVSGAIWALATLLGGVFVAGLYWVMHHSTLRPGGPPQ